MKKISLALATIALATAAQAATISSTFNLPSSTTPINLTGALNKFDLAQGTLTGAVLTVNGIATSTGSLSNTASIAQNFKFNTSLDWLFTLGGTGANQSFSLNPLSSGAGFTSIATGAVLNYTATAANTNATAVFTLTGADLAAFTGTGTNTVACQTFEGTSIVGSTNLTAKIDTKAGCNATIVYTFTAPVVTTVPLPASALLVGFGLFGLAATRRKSV